MSIDFEPVKVETGRRRVDPLVVGVIVVAIGLVAAIVKPWDQGVAADLPRSAVTAVAPSVVPSKAPSPSPSGTAKAVVPSAPVARAPTWAELASVVSVHDAWGVQVLLNGLPTLYGAPADPRFIEVWSPATTDATGVETAVVAGDYRSIEALGVTIPGTEAALDARVWRVHGSGRLEWMEVVPIDSEHADGSFLFVRPQEGGSRFQEWEAGRYRIDVLVRDGIHRLAVEVPGRFDTVPPLDDWAFTRQGITPASQSEPPAVFNGMFAFVDGVGVPLVAKPFRSLGEEEAWLDLAGIGGDGLATGDGGLATGVVASAYVPRTSGLGVMFPSGASIEAASLRRLAPDGPFESPAMSRGNSDRRGRSPFVFFEAPDGEVWAPGVYAITVDWTLGAFTHSDTWHAELRPGRGEP